MYHTFKKIHKSQGFILIFFFLTKWSHLSTQMWSEIMKQNVTRTQEGCLSRSPLVTHSKFWDGIEHWACFFFAIRNVDSFENGFLSCGLIFTLRDCMFLVHSAGGWFSSWEGDFWLAWHSRRWPWLQQSPPPTVSCPLPTRLNAHVS